MHDIIVRRTDDPEEVEQARRLTDESWLDVYPALIGEDTTRAIIVDRHSGERFAANAADGDAWFLVALGGGRVVGHLFACPDEGVYIDRLHVAPAMRGRGVGKAMIDTLRTLLPTGTRLWLTVLNGNDRARAFYVREGFALGAEVDGLSTRRARICALTV